MTTAPRHPHLTAWQESVWTALAYGGAGLTGLWGVLKLWDSNRTKRSMQREQNDFDSDNNAMVSLTSQVASLTRRVDSQQMTIDKQAERIMDMGLRLAELPAVKADLVAARSDVVDLKAKWSKERDLKHHFVNQLALAGTYIPLLQGMVRRLDPDFVRINPDPIERLALEWNNIDTDEEAVWIQIENRRIDADIAKATKKGSMHGVASPFADKPIQ